MRVHLKHRFNQAKSAFANRSNAVINIATDSSHILDGKILNIPPGLIHP